MDRSNSVNLRSISASEQGRIDYTAKFINIINKLVDVLFKLLQMKCSSGSPFDIDWTIVLVFILISFVYTVAAEMITHEPNASNHRTIGPIVHVSGVLTYALLLLVLFPQFRWFILLPCCAFLFVILIRVLHGSRHQIFEFLHGIFDGIYTRLHNSFQHISNLFCQAEVDPRAFSGNSMGSAPAAVPNV